MFEFVGSKIEVEWQLLDKVQDSENQHIQIFIYPNPANSQIVISYSLEKSQIINLSISDHAGNLIGTLYSDILHSAGDFMVVYKVDKLPTGLYFLNYRAGNQERIEKFVILK